MRTTAKVLTAVLALSTLPAISIAQGGLGGAATIYNSIERGRELERQRQRKIELERREDERYELERRARQRAAERGEILPQAAPPAASAAVTASDVSAPLGSCLLDSTDRPLCAPPGRGIAKDSIGRIACGKGQCVAYGIGHIACSSIPGGGAVLDSTGNPRCVGGCEDASEHYCVVPR